MKTRSNKILLLVIISSVILYSGCSILDENPVSELSIINFYQTEADAVMAINACYEALPINRNYHIMLEPTTDNLLIKNAESENYQNGAFDSQSTVIELLWNRHYQMIYRCNTVLERIPEMSIVETKKNQILGEARFLRALGYFNLVRLWGDVPMVTKSVNDVNDFSVIKEPRETIYNDLIIPDLNFAIQHLPNQLVGSSRATKDAARGVLASVYLTKAGNDNADLTHWVAARDTALAVINNRGGLTLTAIKDQLCPVYGDLFKKENKNHKEHIFARQSLAISGMGTELTTFYAASTDYSGAAWIASRWLHPDFFGSFEVVKDNLGKVIRRDDRYATGVNRLFTATEKGVQYKMFWPCSDNPNLSLDLSNQKVYNQNIVSTRNYYKAYWGELPPDDYAFAGKVPTLNGNYRNFNRCAVSKYDDPESTLKSDGGANIPILRYAEILLIYAEAENEINASSANALIALNGVRERAKLPALSAMSQEDFRKQIMKERNSEFFAEHKRYFDLIRREQYIQVMNSSFVGDMIQRTNQHLLFPIPFNEIQANNKLTLNDQNTGW